MNLRCLERVIISLVIFEKGDAGAAASDDDDHDDEGDEGDYDDNDNDRFPKIQFPFFEALK